MQTQTPRETKDQVWLLRDADSFLSAYARDCDDFFFIQIGANDGKLNDPIFKYVKQFNWKGVLLEPLKHVFEKALMETYRGCENLVFVNAAISDTNRTRKLYKLGFSNARWATGLSSFRKEVIEKHIKSGYIDSCAQREGIMPPENTSDYITTEDVTCMTFDDLLAMHQVSRIDLLQIDTEGYDFEVLKLVDFNHIKPSIINYESKHLSQSERKSCVEYLQSEGYLVIEYGQNTIAVVNGLFEIRGIVVNPV